MTGPTSQGWGETHVTEMESDARVGGDRGGGMPFRDVEYRDNGLGAIPAIEAQACGHAGNGADGHGCDPH